MVEDKNHRRHPVQLIFPTKHQETVQFEDRRISGPSQEIHRPPVQEKYFYPGADKYKNYCSPKFDCSQLPDNSLMRPENHNENVC